MTRHVIVTHFWFRTKIKIVHMFLHIYYINCTVAAISGLRP